MATISRTRRPLFAAALFAAVALPAGAAGQDVTNELYGSFRYAVAGVDPEGDARWSAVDNASRLGLRGEIAGDHVEAFYHFEAGALVNSAGGGVALSQRFFLAGVRGGLGSLTLGRHSTAYKMAGLRLDPFYDTSTLGVGADLPRGPVAAGATFGLSRLTNGWADRTLQYATPDLDGFGATAALHPGRDDYHDLGLGVQYAGHGLEGGLQYRRERSGGYNWAPAGGIDDAVRLHVQYRRAERWSVGLSAEDLSPETGDSQRFLYASGTLRPADRLMLAASVGDVGSGDVGHPEGTGIHLGGFVDLLPGARAHVLYSRAGLEGAASRHSLAAGFSLGFAM